MNGLKQRPAIDDEARIGALYNAREDCFLAGNPSSEQYPPGAVQISSTPTQKIQLDHDSSFASKFRMLGVEASLGATILAGWLDCTGSFRLLEEPNGQDDAWSAVYHTLLTVEERLHLGCPALRDCLRDYSLQEATHLVVEIKWGLRSVITAQYPERLSANASALRSRMGEFAAAAEKLASDTSQSHCFALGSNEPLDVMVYSDVLQTDGIIMEDLQEAYEFLKIVPLHIKDINNGKGKPVTYSLLPLEVVGYILQLPLAPQAALSLPRDEWLDQLIKVFDDFQSYRRRLSDHATHMVSKKQYLLPGQMELFEDGLRRLSEAESALKARFPMAVRNARQDGDQGELHRLLQEYVDGDSAPGKIGNVDSSHPSATDVLEGLVARGATYVGGDDSVLVNELERYRHGDVYVLHFDRSGLSEDVDPSWTLNYDRFLNLLDNQKDGTHTLWAIYEPSARKDACQSGFHISYFQMGEEVTQDLLEYERLMSEKCFARCPPDTIEAKDIKKPIKRRFVTMPCPSSQCSEHTDCHWTCPDCLEAIEYGYVDDYFYCGCGRSKYSNYEFQCNGPSHGPRFDQHDPAVMLKSLRDLGSSHYVNILILGETGVGKSTFINALANYLQFATLDDAMASDGFSWLVPCSFSTQTMNRDSLDDEIQEHFVSIGSREDEKDGSKGDSATQRTAVYSVPISSGSTPCTVRLIDTPGIGDTRGPEFDRKNMMDVLATISGYDELHGILILLKPNNSRLTITFQYCVKELLVHLHQSAARNMVFGFTNTRITNYTPGDTFQPLKRLLGGNTNVGLSLSANTTYCFDSESFRYLAASKQGIHMPNKADFDRSWDHSRHETVRLIEHFRSVRAHLTKSTMSLNGARRSIRELTRPMADISQMIRKNIAVCTDKKAELADKRLTGDQLRNNLHIDKIQLKPEPLVMPRTVCAHTDCTEVRDDGTGRSEKVTVYKTHCHDQCSLDDVPHDVLAPPSLMNCAAFGGSQTCSRCRHHWSEHMHIIYELKEHTVTVEDSTVAQQLRDHADDITLRQTAITNLDQTIREYQDEHDIVRDAAARFGVFLKHHSITPINDATEAYLDFLIKAEKDKVDVGGNDAKLQTLTEDLQRHKEAMAVLTRSFAANTTAAADDLTEAAIERTIGVLYDLKHFGENLKCLREGISSAHEATNREIPLSFKRHPFSASGRRSRKLEFRRHNYTDGSASGGASSAGRAQEDGDGKGLFTKAWRRGQALFTLGPSGSSR
ncbi:uncharacterized protein PV07_11107 [Cladophialophora immunda]|uniref:Uncharacterized protein n=1 Tax=Cladophialophora immunda TaxID=569365 RepID=A0A0D2CH06_9EURO|nr:uncharacterized protein PV07_11107 [Cladophialophora immunda]KIW22854.1 hypothetical protein PV07_11107 [Cladophialophora immunda]